MVRRWFQFQIYFIHSTRYSGSVWDNTQDKLSPGYGQDISQKVYMRCPGAPIIAGSCGSSCQIPTYETPKYIDILLILDILPLRLVILLTGLIILLRQAGAYLEAFDNIADLVFPQEEHILGSPDRNIPLTTLSQKTSLTEHNS
jgi:hypothetical protein